MENTPTEQAPKPKRRSQLLHSASTEDPASHQSDGPTPAEKEVEPTTGESVDSSATNTDRTENRVQKRPGKPPPPRQAKKSEGKPEGRKPQRRMTMPSKPPPPRTSTQPQSGSNVTAQEECSGEGVNQPAAKRRMTVASEQKVGTSEGKTSASEDKSATGEGREGKSGGEEDVKVTVKKPARRRMPMVIRPMQDEEERTGGEGKSSATTKTKKTVAGSSPKPARPPGRPTAQPSRKQQTIQRPGQGANEHMAPPKPSTLPSSPQQTADQGTDKRKAPSEETKAVPEDKLPSPQPVTIADAQVESSGSETARPRERTEEAEEITSHSQANSELQTAESASAVGKSEEVVEEVGVGEKESVADGELHDATKTEEEGAETGSCFVCVCVIWNPVRISWNIFRRYPEAAGTRRNSAGDVPKAGQTDVHASWSAGEASQAGGSAAAGTGEDENKTGQTSWQTCSGPRAPRPGTVEVSLRYLSEPFLDPFIVIQTFPAYQEGSDSSGKLYK